MVRTAGHNEPFSHSAVCTRVKGGARTVEGFEPRFDANQAVQFVKVNRAV